MIIKDISKKREMGFQPKFIQGSDTSVTGFAKLEYTPLPEVVSFFPPLGGNAGPVAFGFIPRQIPHSDELYSSKRKQSDFRYESFTMQYNYEEKVLCFRT